MGLPPTSSASPTLSLVLATINERKNLDEILAGLDGATPADREVIVVDDGSTDGTRELLQEAARRDPRVRFLFHDRPQTTVFAHLAGLRAARGRYAIIMDADLQHPVEALPRLLRALEQGNDVAVASRYLPGGATGERAPFRGLVSRVAAFLASMALSNARGLSDPMSGFFGVRRDAVELPPPSTRGYKVLLFVLAASPRLRIAEVPYVFGARTRGESKVVSGFGFIRVYLNELLHAKRIESRSRATHRRPPPGGRRDPSSPAA